MPATEEPQGFSVALRFRTEAEAAAMVAARGTSAAHIILTVADATTLIRDGQRITADGTNGVVPLVD